MNEAEKEMTREYYKELMEQESVTYALISSISAIVPAFVSIYLLGMSGKIPMYLLILPGIIIGLCAKFGGGNAYRMRVKIIPAIAAFTVMIVVWILSGFLVPALIMSIPNALVAYYLGKRQLTERQELAKHRVERGIVKL